MNNKGTVTMWIRNKHIVLRHFDESDACAMFCNWAADKEVTKFLTWDAYNDVWNVSKKIEEWISNYNSPFFYHWAIEYEGKLIGSISAKVNKDSATDRAELGYCIGRKWWNKGITTAAAKAVVDYMFTECNAHSFGIEHAVNNPASGKVAEKLGMHLDGCRPEYFKANDGTWQDINMWSILLNEWNSK